MLIKLIEGKTETISNLAITEHKVHFGTDCSLLFCFFFPLGFRFYYFLSQKG